MILLYGVEYFIDEGSFVMEAIWPMLLNTMSVVSMRK